MTEETCYDDVPMENPQEMKLACALALDTSGSMSGDAIKQLNEGLNLFKSEILADKQASVTVEPCVITFGSKARIAQPFGEAHHLPDGGLRAGGSTAMGRALETALKELEDRRRHYRANGILTYRPWLFLITDGRPTDMGRGDNRFNAIRERIRKGESDKRFMFFAIGVDGADMDVLARLSPPNRPPLKLRGHSFQEFFQWLSDTAKSASRSSPGDQFETSNPTEGDNPWAVLGA